MSSLPYADRFYESEMRVMMAGLGLLMLARNADLFFTIMHYNQGKNEHNASSHFWARHAVGIRLILWIAAPLYIAGMVLMTVAIAETERTTLAGYFGAAASIGIVLHVLHESHESSRRGNDTWCFNLGHYGNWIFGAFLIVYVVMLVLTGAELVDDQSDTMHDLGSASIWLIVLADIFLAFARYRASSVLILVCLLAHVMEAIGWVSFAFPAMHKRSSTA